MPGGYYTFAIFVFLLAICFVLLVRKIWFAKSSAARQLQEKEAKLFKLYQHVEDLMDGFEEYVSEANEQLVREKIQINKQAEDLLAKAKELVSKQEMPIVPNVPLVELPEVPAAEDIGKRQPISNSQKIVTLWHEGMNEEEICRELGLGKGEVTLVLRLMKL